MTRLRLKLALVITLLLTGMAAQADDGAAKLDAEASEAQLQQVEQALSVGRLVQADAMLRWLDPRLVAGYRNRFDLTVAEYHLAREDVAAAEAAIATVNAALADTCRFSGISGWIAFQRQDWNRAISQLASAVDGCSGDAGRWNLLGQALARKGEYAASIEAFDAALALGKGKAAVLNNRALSLAYSGALHAAINDLSVAAAIDTANPAIIENLAFVRARAGLDYLAPAAGANLEARSLTMAGEGASSAQRPDAATSYYARAVLAYERFDPSLWQRANGAAGEKAQ